MIEIEKHIPAKYRLFSPSTKYLGDIENEWELTNARLLISKEDVQGYYILMPDNTINCVDNNGQLERPLYEENLVICSKFLKYNNDKRKLFK